MILNTKQLKKHTIRLLLASLFILIGYGLGSLHEDKKIDKLETELKVVKQELAIQLFASIKVIERYETLHNIIQCESGYRHDGLVGDLEYPYQAYGIGQFQLRTFMMLAEEVGLEKPDIWNMEQHLTLINHALNTGRGDLWTCYRKLYG